MSLASSDLELPLSSHPARRMQADAQVRARRVFMEVLSEIPDAALHDDGSLGRGRFDDCVTIMNGTGRESPRNQFSY